MNKVIVPFFWVLIILNITFTLASDISTLVQTRMRDMGFSSKDVAVGPSGIMMVVGSDGRVYKFNSKEHEFDLVSWHDDLPKMSRIVIDDDGTPYVVSECGGQAFYLDCNNNWVALSGCVRDLGVGKHGEIWAIGCDERVGGYGIWRLFCDYDCSYGSGIKYCRHQKNVFINYRKKNCHWNRIEGAGIRIDIDSKGNPWVVAENNQVYHYDGINWKSIPGFKAIDIAISNEDVIFAAGADKTSTGRLVNFDLGTWQNLAVPSINIAVGPFSHFFVITHEGKLLSSIRPELY